MISKTHGQPASPTTMGKEISVFTYRLNRTLNQIYNIDFLGNLMVLFKQCSPFFFP